MVPYQVSVAAFQRVSAVGQRNLHGEVPAAHDMRLHAYLARGIVEPVRGQRLCPAPGAAPRR